MKLGVVLLDCAVEVGASESEGGYSRSSGKAGRRCRPLDSRSRHEEGDIVPLDRGVRLFKSRRRGDSAVVQCETRLQQTCHSRSRLQVANLTLDGADCNPVTSTGSGEHPTERLQLGSITNLRAGPVCLNQFDAPCTVSGLLHGAQDRLLLTPSARCGDALAATVARGADSTDHRVNRVAVSDGVSEPLENHTAGTLAHHEAVRPRIEGSGVSR